MKPFDTEVELKLLSGESEEIDRFIGTEFYEYAKERGLELKHDSFCVIAENSRNEVIGVISGIAYYYEVCIQSLIVKDGYRQVGVGSRLLRFIEGTYKSLGYSVISAETYKFQAPGFYEKLGFIIEHVRSMPDERLNKYYLSKEI